MMKLKGSVLAWMAAVLMMAGSAVAQEEKVATGETLAQEEKIATGADSFQEEASKGPIPEVGTVFSLGEVVVTGERDAVEKIATTEIIDEERIDLTTSRTVSEALDTLPGVFLHVGTRNEQVYNIRGFDQRYVPIFYDGIPIYVPNDGYIDGGKLPTANISQVTLTKGNSSVLYGLNTMAGAINIVSKKPQEKIEASFDLGGRQSNTFDSNLYVGSKQDLFYVAANVGYLNSDGYRVSNNMKVGPNQGHGTRNNSDVAQTNGSMKVGFTPAEGHEYAIGVNHVDSEWGVPPDAYATSRPELKWWRFTDWEKDTYYLIGDSKLTDKLSSKIRIYHDTYYNVLDSYDDNTYSKQTKKYAFHSIYDDHSDGGSLTLRGAYIPQNTTSFSFHYKDDVHKEQDNTGGAWENYETEYFSFGLEDDWAILENLSFVVGASYDLQNPKYANGAPVRDDDNAFNPQAGLNYTVLKDLGLHVSVGKKTRFPTLHELYSGRLGQNEPNPNLSSEESVNYELGAEKPLPGRNFAGINLFYSDVKNLIVSKEIKPGIDQYQNIGKATFSGVEVTFKSLFIPRNTFEVSYTYLNSEDKSPNRTSDHLEERPENKFYVSDLYQMTDWLALFGKLEYYSKQWYEDPDTGWQELDGFVTFDFKLIGTVSDNLTLEAGVQNMFDEDYSLANGYPRAGRTFFGMLRTSF
jgi:iron complex outermembrane receptor protein